MIEKIYVGLLGESVEVWRPVQAKHIEGNIYLIVDQPYDREIESWQFEPGEQVVCNTIESSDGSILVAAKRAIEESRL